jgi:hypothetical protein
MIWSSNSRSGFSVSAASADNAALGTVRALSRTTRRSSGESIFT